VYRPRHESFPNSIHDRAERAIAHLPNGRRTPMRVTIAGVVYDQLQVATGATIVLDDGVDLARGGGNLAAGRAPLSPADPWVGEGPATVTPTSTDLRDALGNLNLTSLAVAREAIGTAILDVSFANPTNTFFFYERGSGTVAGNSNRLVEALNEDGEVIAAYKLLRGSYADTGLVVSTDVGAFSVANVKLRSIGIQLDVFASRVRLISTQAATSRTEDRTTRFSRRPRRSPRCRSPDAREPRPRHARARALRAARPRAGVRGTAQRREALRPSSVQLLAAELARTLAR
jgi:hypothetical protein